MKSKRAISKSKIESVEELSNLIKSKKSILIVSIKNIPASQFQKIGKKLRGKAIVKVPKKNLIFRAIDSSRDEAIKQLKKQIKNNVAILFSDMDCFDLALDLSKNKSPAKAKAGQLAPKDIEVEEGLTNLVPGPAISELGNLGIEIQIEKGKIYIKKPKIIVKKGDRISTSAADIMSKLDIKPFSIWFVPLCAFDTREKKLYLNIEIDKEKTLGRLKEDFRKALAFAVEIKYLSKDTIKFLIAKAGTYEKVLENLIKEKKVEKINESKKEESNKEKNETKQEKKPKGEKKNGL